MFKDPQGMSLADNAAATASADATSAATATADKTKMCASSLIFRATKLFFSLASWADAPEPPTKILVLSAVAVAAEVASGETATAEAAAALTASEIPWGPLNIDHAAYSGPKGQLV